MARGWARAWVLLTLLLLWQAGAWVGSGNAIALPGPMALAESAWPLLTGGELVAALSATLLRVLAGFSLAGAAGVLAGCGLARTPALGAMLTPLVVALHAVPAICWLPLAAVWAGLQEEAVLLVTALGVLPAVTLSTENALRTVPRPYLRAAATMGARGRPLLWRVLLPAALPSLLDGLRGAWVLGWSSAMAAELLMEQPGLGRLLAGGEGDAPRAVVALGAIMLLGLLVDRLALAWLTRYVRTQWGISTKKAGCDEAFVRKP